jgi:hypothetical protein
MFLLPNNRMLLLLYHDAGLARIGGDFNNSAPVFFLGGDK